jgi:protein-histidine pros-kinase
MLEHETFDVILMDVQMPVMGGFEAARLIREMEIRSGTRTPIIAVTARAMAGDRAACLAAGMDDFVPKPIQSARLIEAMENLVSRSKGDAFGQNRAGSQRDTPDGEVTAVTHEHVDLDEAGLLTLVGGDRALAGELAEIFLDDLEPRLTEITAAVTARDPERLRAGAHALRGSAATMMAKNVTVAAAALETMGHVGLLDGVQQALDQLNTALTALRPRLVALAGGA